MASIEGMKRATNNMQSTRTNVSIGKILAATRRRRGWAGTAAALGAMLLASCANGGTSCEDPPGVRDHGFAAQFDIEAARVALRARLPEYMVPNLFTVLPAPPSSC